MMQSKGRNGAVDYGRVIALVAVVLFMPAADAKPDSFCQRLAPQLNMKPSSASREAPSEWKVNLLGGLGPALFGGTAIVSLSVRPIDETMQESRRLTGSCSATKKGAICNIEGPARLTVGTKKGEVVADASTGERATVEMRGTSVYCREGSHR